jgi:hypothetical protein
VCVQCDRKRDKRLREDWDELRSSRRSSPGVEGIGITSTGRIGEKYVNKHQRAMGILIMLSIGVSDMGNKRLAGWTRNREERDLGLKHWRETPGFCLLYLLLCLPPASKQARHSNQPRCVSWSVSLAEDRDDLFCDLFVCSVAGREFEPLPRYLQQRRWWWWKSGCCVHGEAYRRFCFHTHPNLNCFALLE